MTRPTLPPRGIFIPTQIIFHPELPSAVLVSWIKLRSLAWDGWDTPPMNLPQLASHLGIHPSRLSRHLAQLQELSTLISRDTGDGKIVLSFPEQSYSSMHDVAGERNFPYSEPLPIKESETWQPAAYFPHQILGYISYEDDEEDLADHHKLVKDHKPDLATLKICSPEIPAILAR